MKKENKKILEGKKISFKDLLFWLHNNLNEKFELDDIIIKECYIYNCPKKTNIIYAPMTHFCGFRIRERNIIVSNYFTTKNKNGR
ncbi:MAG: hypothetical protein ACFFG0_02985 [Candidatus Thorarchaeota archaeon]